MRISDWSSDVCSSDLLSCGFYAGFRYLKDCGKFLVTVDRLRQLSENEPAVTASVFVQFHNGMTRRAAASEEVQNDGVRVVPGRSEQAIVDSQKALREGKRRRSEEHTSELQSLMRISYAVFCLQKKKMTAPYRLYKKNKTNIHA